MLKKESVIISASIEHMKNDKTGEVVDYTKVLYTVSQDSTNDRIGAAVLECYVKGRHLDKLKQFILKSVTLEIAEQYVKNGTKYRLHKINDVEF